MKKFNLFQEIIIVNKLSLLQAVNSAKLFAIDIYGNISYAPFESTAIFIFQGKHNPQPVNALMPTHAPTIASILGKNYQVVEDDDRVLIKAFSNWQEIIKLNVSNASYDDTTADGVSEFSDKALEEIGWHATEFHINYRSMVEKLEESCEGILLCIEQENPYQFSGLGFLFDNLHAKETLLQYCKTKIQELMANDKDYKKENLTDDELEAAEFFSVI